MKRLSFQSLLMQNYLTIFPIFNLLCYTRHGVSLMLWLPSVSAELGYGCTGERGEMGLAQVYSSAPKCCVACQQQLPVRWELAWPASANRGQTLLRSLGCIHAYLEHWSFLPLTHILGSAAHCPPWPPSQPFLRSLCPYFPFCFLE